MQRGPIITIPNVMRAGELMILLFDRFCWIDEKLQAHFRQSGWPEVSRPQTMVLISIAVGVRRPADIARRLGISRQAIHKTIDQMVQKGIVELDPDPEDKRLKLLSLTDFGSQMRTAAQQGLRQVESEITSQIGDVNLSALVNILASRWTGCEDNNVN